MKLVTVERCRELYPSCTDNHTEVTEVTTPVNGTFLYGTSPDLISELLIVHGEQCSLIGNDFCFFQILFAHVSMRARAT